MSLLSVYRAYSVNNDYILTKKMLNTLYCTKEIVSDRRLLVLLVEDDVTRRSLLPFRQRVQVDRN
jgi:hypothetical protein